MTETDHAHDGDDHSHLPPKSSVKRWLVTTNHKDIGVLYMITALFFLVFGGILALMIRIQLWQSGPVILNSLGYNQVVTAHGLLMVFWFLSPFATGLANYLVPLQIGAEDLAFPRLNALSYWLYVASGVLLGISFFQGSSLPTGWTVYAPLNLPAFIPEVAELGAVSAVVALILFVSSITIGSVNFITTIYRMRAEGLRMRDIPLFSMSWLLTVWMMLFAFAALLAALMILSADHLLATEYFSSENGGSLLWTHLFWFFGHPEVYIVFFPALGVMAEITQTFSGRRLVGRKWFIIAMALVAIQSFIVWMHHMFLTSINLPIKTVMMVTTIGISLPFDLMVFALIYTMIKGRIRYKTPFLFVLGALLLFILGGITGVFLGAIVLDYSFRGTYWVTAHFHYVMASGAVALIGGIYYWYPKITGKMYNEFLGKIHFAAAFIGFNMLYFPLFIVWDTPRRWFHYEGTVQIPPVVDFTLVETGFTIWHQIATVGAFLFAASFLLMFYNLFVSLYSDRDAGESPWAYTGSSEWSVSSPPPLENFPGTPSFKTGKLNFLDGPGVTDGGEVETDGGVASAEAAVEEHADHASWGPIMLSAAALLTGLGISGLTTATFPYPFLFAVPVFLLGLGLEGARVDGFTPLHGLYLAVAFPFLAVMVLISHVHVGFFETILAQSKYFWLTFVGTSFGLYSLVHMGFEGFSVPEPKASEQWPFSKVDNTKLGMWVFLASDIVLFGAFVGSYVFIRIVHGWQDWWHTAEEGALESHAVWPGLLNTYILLASSFAVVLALTYARKGDKRKTLAFMSATFLGGALFLVNKIYEWVELYIHQGWTYSSDVMASTYYITTGLHGVHVIVGMLIMLFLILRASTGAYWSEGESADTLEYFGLYWHFVDIVWLFLFPLFFIL